MAEPAIIKAIEAIVAKVEAIEPTIEPTARFVRRGERAPPTTKNRRTFDVGFIGHLRDLSNEGLGVQTHGLADRIAQLAVAITYPVARDEAALETRLAVDSELVLRALHRSAVWTGTPVRRCAARTATDRSKQDAAAAGSQGAATIDLVVTVDVQYRDSEA